MHKQIRAVPRRSPADLAAFLEVLADARINILAAGGGDLEFGGEFAFAVSHEEHDAAVAALEGLYTVRVLEPYVCEMEPQQVGELLRCVREAQAQNLVTGSSIRDLSIGVPDDTGRVPVMIYSDVREGRELAS